MEVQIHLIIDNRSQVLLSVGRLVTSFARTIVIVFLIRFDKFFDS